MNIDLEDDNIDQYVPSGKKKLVKKTAGKVIGKVIQDKEIFKTALAKFRKGGKTNFFAVADLLSVYTENHLNEELAWKIYGYSQAECGNLNKAKEAFRQLFSLNSNDAEVLNALAYIALSDEKLDQAVNYMLDAVYLEPNNSHLKSNLEKLRNVKDPKVFLKMNPPAGFLIIRLPKESVADLILTSLKQFIAAPASRLALVSALIVIVGFLIYLFYPAIVNLSENMRFTQGLGRGRVTHVSIQDIDKLVEERKLYNIRLTEDEVKQKFEMAKAFLTDKKRNRAVITLNELLNSNASEGIKERIRILQDFIPDPDPNNIDFTPVVQDVIKIPYLYQDVAIRWNGTIANLEHKERKETVFDLLINFVDTATVEGIAEIHLEGFQKIQNGSKVNVFGTITGISEDNRILLKGVEIQPLGK